MADQSHASEAKENTKKPDPTADPAGLQDLDSDAINQKIFTKQKALPRMLPPNAILQLQRTAGNRAVTRLQNTTSTTKAIQRGGPTPGVGMGTDSITVFLERTIQAPPIKSTYADIIFSVPVKASATLKAKNAPNSSADATANPSGGSASVSVNLYDSREAATSGGSDRLAQLAYEKIETSGFEVDSIDWDSGGKKGESEGGNDTFSMSTAIVLKFKNGQTETLTATLFEKEAGLDMSGPSLEIKHTVNFLNEVLWENDSAVLTLTAPVGVAMKIKPNWLRIMTWARRMGGSNFGRVIMSSALRGITSFMLGPGGFIAGGFVTVASLFAALSSINDIENCKAQARAALSSYISGFCTAWGIDQYGSGTVPEYTAEGFSQAVNKLRAQVLLIQSHPVFVPWGFTAEELTTALREALAQHASDVYFQVEGEMQTKIFTDFVLGFYRKQKASFFIPNYIARKDAEWVAIGLGISPSVLPAEE